MPLNYPQLQPQIQKLGENAVHRENRLQALLEKADEILDSRAEDVDALRAKVERAAASKESLRCAFPIKEPLNAAYPCPEMPSEATLLAVDGSQINPDHHAAIDYYLVNVGGILLHLDGDDAPETFLETQLKYGDDMYTKSRRVTSGDVALERDLAERRYLAQWAGKYMAKNAPEDTLVTLTDGPLELWGAGDPEIGRELDAYLESLETLTRLGAIPAGYVDDPQADLVVRLLEVAQLEENDLSQAGRVRPFRGVSDVGLFTSRLEPGERSAVFGIQSQTRVKYPDHLQLCFFYLNVGDAGNPWLARVEIPVWVGEDIAKIQALHAVLIQQCQILGTQAYPYLLHRSHEIAVVSHEENQLLTDMIRQERWNRRLPVEQTSHKQLLKDQPGRSRIK